MTDSTNPRTSHYWSMEHHGFDDHPPAPTAGTVRRAPRPFTKRMLGGLTLFVALVTGSGAVVAQAVADQDQPGSTAAVESGPGVGVGPEAGHGGGHGGNHGSRR